MTQSKQQKERIWHYTIDVDGRLWHDGSEITDLQVLKFFMHRLEKRDDGSYQVLCQGEINLITAEDTPYVIQGIKILDDQIELQFPGHFTSHLDPETLFVGKENILYCQILDRSFNARFNRSTYFELANLVTFDEKRGGYYLQLGKKEYCIKGVLKK